MAWDGIDHARMIIRFASWIGGLAFACAALSFVWVAAPLNYLLSSVGVGLCWFVMLALTWRTRNGVLHFLTLMLFIFGLVTLSEQLRRRGLPPIPVPCMFLSIAVMAAPMILFRRWLLKFARLEAN